MAIDISHLNKKEQNEGTSEKGRLTAAEWNTLIDAVQENQEAVSGAIKGIKYNETQIFDEIDEFGYLTMTVADTSGYDFWVKATTPPAVIARGSECPISISVTNKVFQEDGSKIPNVAYAAISIYINDILVNEGIVYDSEFANDKGSYYDPTKSTVYTYDLSTAKTTQFLPGKGDGKVVNTVKVVGNNRSGVVKEINFDVEAIDLALTVNSFGKVNVFTESNKPKAIVTVTGTDANINAKVDGVTIISDYKVNAGETTNIGESCFNISPVNEHGVHTLEIWASTTINKGDTTYVVSTQPQIFTYIYGTTDEKPIVMLNVDNVKHEEYSTLNVSYTAYKYSDTVTAVKDEVSIVLCEFNGYDSSGKPIPGNTLGDPVTNEITFDVTSNSGSGTAGISLFPIIVDDKNVSLKGKKFIKTSIGDFAHYTEIEVIESSVKLSQLGGYAVYLTSAGRNNNQADKREWISKNGKNRDGSKLEVRAIFPDDIEFLDTGSGWIYDGDRNNLNDPNDKGNVALRLKRGKHFTLDYQPFDVNPVFEGDFYGNGLGKTISFEIATRNCLKSDATVISCMDSSNGSTERGFEITASSAILKSNNFGLKANFRENTRVKIDFVIEGSKNGYQYTTIAGKDATEDDWEKNKISNEALCIIYVDGVYQCLKKIPDGGSTFLQGREGIPAPKITFGSDHCDLDIYNIRIYDQALTPAQIVNNYSYDTPRYEDKLAIAARNDIFDATNLGNKPNINKENLRKARPNLPFFFVKMDIDNSTGTDTLLPYDKTNWKVNTYNEWENPMNKLEKTGDAISFTTDAGNLRNQGTSSMTYPWPWRNWDWKLNKDQNSGEFKFGDNSTDTKWCQYLGMSDTENISKITFKKDYASSEMCNNAITSEYFTDMAIGIGGNSGFENVLSPAQRELKSLTPFRLTFKAIPCFMFQEFNDPNKQGTAGKGYEALGMMNLIPNKNECGHLGFMGNYVWKPSEFKRSQSWELKDNMDNWFWYKKITPIRVENDTDKDGNPITKIVNECISCYEARYPKDSTLNKNKAGEFKWNNAEDEADFGGTPKKYITLTNEQKEAINIEQSDIIEFHNWLVDCNRQIPEDYYNGLIDDNYEPLPVEQQEFRGYYRKLNSNDLENNSWNTGKHTVDSPEYRLDKFIAESPTRMIIDQFCLYYIWRETFHAFDSGFKNLQLYSMGKANDNVSYLQWGCMVRDADTTLGIENTGKDIFPPHLEDIDYYTADTDAEGNAVSNVKFIYGGARNVYHANTIDNKGGHPVLNGQFGTLWINLRDAFGSRIAAIYGELKRESSKTNWNATAAIKRFRDHQEKWCENLYNFGMRQYFGGAPFTKWIESGLGDKKNSRASWLERGFYYRDSKYQVLNDICTIRAITYSTPDDPINGSTADTPLKMKSYIPMYFLCKASEEDPSTCDVQIRVTDTDNTFDVVPGENGIGLANSGDQNKWFWGASQLTEIGDLARVCKVKMFQKLDLPKVRDFSLGHEKDRTNGIPYREYYDGNNVRELQNEYLESIEVSSLKQMEVFDITNHKVLNLIEGLEECTQLKELYAKGTDALTTIDLPATTSIKTLYFGKSLTSIKLSDLTNIEKFELEGGDFVEKLVIENCGTYMSKRSYDVVSQVISSLENSRKNNPNTNVCKLVGIDWTGEKSCTVEMLKRLYDIDAQLEGKIQLVGDLTNDFKVKLVNKYGSIDNEDSVLHILYSQKEITSVTLPNKMYIYTPGTHQLTFNYTPSSANTYEYAEWSLENANGYATIDSKTGIITRTDLEATETTSPATLKVTVYQTRDNINNVDRPAKESNSCLVYFYERKARPGDIVYADGTFTDENISTTSNPAIGVCFYVEESNDPNETPKRLMVSLSSIMSNNLYTGLWSKWGVGDGILFNDGTSWGSPQINAADYGFKDMNDIINIPAIHNINEHGGNYISESQLLTDALYRNSSNKDNGEFEKYSFRSCMGNIGWKNTDNDIIINDETVVDHEKSYPIGYIYTMAMIERRNLLIRKLNNNNIKITGSNNNGSELENLLGSDGDFMKAEAVSLNGYSSNTSNYLYPAASVAYAYEPGGEGTIPNLNDKFKKHNWFLPSSGEAVRIAYYVRQYYFGDSENSDYKNPDGSYPFDLAINDKIFKTAGWYTMQNGSLSASPILTSSEYGDNAKKYVVIDPSGVSPKDDNSQGTGMCRGNDKSTYSTIRPICMF